MRILFVHQNFPGQYFHLAPALTRRGHEVIAISNRPGVRMPGIRIETYQLSRDPRPGTHPFVKRFERAIDYGVAAGDSALKLKAEGFEPDIICAHPGWGETLYLRDVWPRSKQLHYCEFMLQPFGPMQIFDPRATLTLHEVFAHRIGRGVGLFGLETMDAGVTPTKWQRDQFPSRDRDRISVVHDGVNAGICQPSDDAVVTLPGGRQLTRAKKVITYVSRNLEPARGFPQFIRAIELVLFRRHDVEVLVIGGDELSYSAPHPSGKPWREIVLNEVDVDRDRLHFLGKVPYEEYLRVLQISAVHVYLTAPFVLSWSLLEAMATQCLVVASDTEPVREVLRHGENAILVDFFDKQALANAIGDAVERNQDFGTLRRSARAMVLDQFSRAKCLPAQIAMVESLARGGT